MSTTLHAAAEQSQTGRSLEASAYTFSPAATVWAFCSALYDGLVAYRQYEHLKSCGIQHAAALRHALLHPDRAPTLERGPNVATVKSRYFLTGVTMPTAAAILVLTVLPSVPGASQSGPLEVSAIEEERDRTCSKLHEWTERFHCIYEFTVLARRVREFPSYSGVEPKEDVQRDIELSFEKLKQQFAIPS